MEVEVAKESFILILERETGVSKEVLEYLIKDGKDTGSCSRRGGAGRGCAGW